VFSVSFAVKDEHLKKFCTHSWSLGFYVLGGQTFVPHLRKKKSTFQIMLYILASEEVAKKCNVTIYISGKNFKMSYTTTAVLIETPISEVKKTKKLYLPLTNF
jgi:hypothetical protein